MTVQSRIPERAKNTGNNIRLKTCNWDETKSEEEASETIKEHVAVQIQFQKGRKTQKETI